VLIEAREGFVNPLSAVMSAPDNAPDELAVYRAPRYDDPSDVPDLSPCGPRAVIKIIIGNAERARVHIQPFTSEERSRRS
jgi:hypothetical protein